MPSHRNYNNANSRHASHCTKTNFQSLLLLMKINVAEYCNLNLLEERCMTMQLLAHENNYTYILKY